MKLEITVAISSKKDLFEYIKAACKSAEECGIGDNVTLKVTYFDEQETKQVRDFMSIFSKGE